LNGLGGVYLEDVEVSELAIDPSIPNGVKPYSLDEMSAKKLWTLSEELTGIEFSVS
jgi:hypothetical protein